MVPPGEEIFGMTLGSHHFGQWNVFSLNAYIRSLTWVNLLQEKWFFPRPYSCLNWVKNFNSLHQRNPFESCATNSPGWNMVDFLNKFWPVKFGDFCHQIWWKQKRGGRFEVSRIQVIELNGWNNSTTLRILGIKMMVRQVLTWTVLKVPSWMARCKLHRVSISKITIPSAMFESFGSETWKFFDWFIYWLLRVICPKLVEIVIIFFFEGGERGNRLKINIIQHFLWGPRQTHFEKCTSDFQDSRIPPLYINFHLYFSICSKLLWIIWRCVQFFFTASAFRFAPVLTTSRGGQEKITEEFYNTQSTSWWNDAGQLLENTLKGEDSSVVEHLGAMKNSMARKWPGSWWSMSYLIYCISSKVILGGNVFFPKKREDLNLRHCKNGTPFPMRLWIWESVTRQQHHEAIHPPTASRPSTLESRI